MSRGSPTTVPDPCHLAVLRAPSGLIEVRSRRLEPAADAKLEQEQLAGRYVVERVPVSGAPRRAISDLTAVADAWLRLANVVPDGPRVLADCLVVLLATVSETTASDAPPLRLTSAAQTRRASAAHPRAYKGTTRHLPKAAAPAVTDLRPALCSMAHTRQLLTHLWPARAEAVARLRHVGFDARRLAHLTAGGTAPRDPYLTYHFGFDARLPEAFATRVLPALDGASAVVVRTAVGLHERLGFAQDDTLAGVAARIARLAGAERAVAWWAVLELLPVDRRLAFAVLLLETGAWTVTAARVAAEVFVDLGHHAPAERYLSWANEVLSGLAQDLEPAYLASGLKLACAYGKDSSFYWRGDDDAPDFGPATAATLDRWQSEDLTYSALQLWRACGQIPGLATYLERHDWPLYSAQQRRALFSFLISMMWSDARPPEHTRAVLRHMPLVERHLRDIPASHVGQFAHDLGKVLDTETSAAQVQDGLPLAVELLARLNRPPFDANGNLAHVVGHLLKLPAAQRRRALEAPDASYLRFDKACRRSNAASLIAWGLSSLRSVMPDLVADSFVSAPGSLARCARQLGVLSWPARRQVLNRCAALPIFSPHVPKRRLADIVASIDDVCPPGSTTVVSRALREHVAGRRTLTQTQLEAHRARLLAGLPVVRLAAIEAAVEARLANTVGLRSVTRGVLDALAMLQDADENRRALQRFLRAHVGGDEEYLRRHPRTQAWIRAHPRIDVELWTRGLERRLTRPGLDVTLRLEQDPLEMLQLGTHVGSCLGLGGSFAASAAAVLLDVNKQVVYAHDAHGAVVARQLLAISKDDRLAAFAVYPASAPRALCRAFDRYDDAFAAALGIARLLPEDDYYVEDVLSHYWMDDGLRHPDDSATTESKRGRRA